MNSKSHELPEVSLEESQVRDTLECLLHSILFHRQLGPAFPQEESLMETLTIPLSYCKIGTDDHGLHSKVTKAINSFCAALAKHKADNKIGYVFNVTLRFVHAIGPQTLEWERWVIPLRIKSRASKQDLHQALYDGLLYINQSTDAAIEDKYIPVNNGDHFEFQILHEVGTTTLIETVGNLLSYLSYR